jgi:hypothetical protein
MAAYHCHSLTSWQVNCFLEQWLVTTQAECSCIAVNGMDQWLCIPPIDGRARHWLWALWLIRAELCCLTTCPSCHFGSRHIPELRHRILRMIHVNDELASLDTLQSPDRNRGLCCIALWNYGSAFTVIWIWRIKCLDVIVCLSVYTHILSNNRQHSASEDISWTVSVVQVNM